MYRRIGWQGFLGGVSNTGRNWTVLAIFETGQNRTFPATPTCSDNGACAYLLSSGRQHYCNCISNQSSKCRNSPVSRHVLLSEASHSLPAPFLFLPTLAAAERPNIVSIHQRSRHQRLGCYGRKEHNTPNLDRLIAEKEHGSLATTAPSLSARRHSLQSDRPVAGFGYRRRFFGPGGCLASST